MEAACNWYLSRVHDMTKIHPLNAILKTSASFSYLNAIVRVACTAIKFHSNISRQNAFISNQCSSEMYLVGYKTCGITFLFSTQYDQNSSTEGHHEHGHVGLGSERKTTVNPVMPSALKHWKKSAGTKSVQTKSNHFLFGFTTHERERRKLRYYPIRIKRTIRRWIFTPLHCSRFR